jgi:hypothetical protein
MGGMSGWCVCGDLLGVVCQGCASGLLYQGVLSHGWDVGVVCHQGLCVKAGVLGVVCQRWCLRGDVASQRWCIRGGVLGHALGVVCWTLCTKDTYEVINFVRGFLLCIDARLRSGRNNSLVIVYCTLEEPNSVQQTSRLA